jgi:hypothetical protein
MVVVTVAFVLVLVVVVVGLLYSPSNPQLVNCVTCSSVKGGGGGGRRHCCTPHQIPNWSIVSLLVLPSREVVSIDTEDDPPGVRHPT